MATKGTIVMPIYAKWDNKEYHLGDLTLEVKIVNGKAKLPSEREIKRLIRRGLA